MGYIQSIEFGIKLIACIFIIPIIIILRIRHCIPILLHDIFDTHKTDDLKHSFGHSPDNPRPSDRIFSQNTYSRVVLGRCKFKNGTDVMDNIDSINRCTQNFFGRNANIKIIDNKNKHALAERIYNNKIHSVNQSDIFGGHTNAVYIYPKSREIVFVIDHYYCDGLVILSSLNAICGGSKLNMHKWPTHVYIPIYSDMLVATTVFNTIKDSIMYPTPIHEVAANGELFGMTRLIDKSGLLGGYFMNGCCDGSELVWNRWIGYAVAIRPLFDCMSVDYLRVAVTCGFANSKLFGNIRTGVIIVRINRPDPSASEFQTLRDMANTIKIQCTYNYNMGGATFDMIRSFNFVDEHTITNNKYRFVDVVFTPINISNDKDIVDELDIVFGDVDTTNPHLYMTNTYCGDTSHVSITSNWKHFNRSKYRLKYNAVDSKI